MSALPPAASGYGICAIGTYVPEARVNCLDRAEQLKVPADTLASRIGFDTLALKPVKQTTSDMACLAVEDLLGRFPVDPSEIGCLIVVTQNPDGHGIPQVSAIVHGRLKWPRAMAAFDISLGCSGYVYALELLACFLRSQGARYGVLVTADPYSKIINVEDRDTALLFGDAATATLVASDGAWKIGASDFGTSGDYAGSLRVDENGHLCMLGKEVSRCCIREVPRSIARALELNGLSVDDADLMLLHQGSKFIVESIGGALGIAERTPFYAQQVGNTCCSSIPLGLARLLDEGSAARTVVLASFGVGLSWGSTVIRLEPPSAPARSSRIRPIPAAPVAAGAAKPA